MKRSNCYASLLVAILVLAYSADSRATGFGVYYEYGWDIPTSGGDLDLATIGQPGVVRDAFYDVLKGTEWGIGFALDTNVAKDRLFNYRMDFGYHRSSAGLLGNSFVRQLGLGDQSNGVMWNNVFGFGVLRTKVVRLYLGPAIRMNFDWYDTSNVFDYQLGLGGQVGVNVNLPGRVTLSAATLYTYKFGWLIDTNSFNLGALPTTSHRDHYVGINFAVFFRTGGDEFQR